MKKGFQIAAAIVLTIVLIFLLVNVRFGFQYSQPERIQVKYKDPLTIETMMQKVGLLEPVDLEKGIFRVGPSSLFIAINKLELLPGFVKATIIPNPPSFSWEKYGQGMKMILDEYIHGNFGQIILRTSASAKPITGELGHMFARTSTYFFAALGTAVFIGLALPIIAARFKWARRIFDFIHRMLLTIPDFLVVALVTYFAIFITKFATSRVILIMQLNNEVPFLIPFLTIALLPSVMIYGTISTALRRELERPYVATAMAKGLSKVRVMLTHCMRNVMEDFFAVLPRATTAAISSMIIAEATCYIVGIGGFVVNQNASPGALPFICIQLALFAFVLHGMYALFRKWLVVQVKEV